MDKNYYPKEYWLIKESFKAADCKFKATITFKGKWLVYNAAISYSPVQIMNKCSSKTALI
jgi:hypothetical protein